MGPGSGKLWLLPPGRLQGHGQGPLKTRFPSTEGGHRRASDGSRPAIVSSLDLLQFQRQEADLNNRSQSFRDRTEGAGLSSAAWSPWRVDKRREIGGLKRGAILTGGGCWQGLSGTGSFNR